MSDDLEKLLESLGELDDRTGMVGWLVDETLAYRDELHTKGIRLTVEDTRLALDELENYLKDRPSAVTMSEVQATLLDRWKKQVDLMQ
ncbi:MAG: hypothetical protein ABIE70_13665 [bacterium]